MGSLWKKVSLHPETLHLIPPPCLSPVSLQLGAGVWATHGSLGRAEPRWSQVCQWQLGALGGLQPRWGLLGETLHPREPSGRVGSSFGAATVPSAQPHIAVPGAGGERRAQWVPHRC